MEDYFTRTTTTQTAVVPAPTAASTAVGVTGPKLQTSYKRTNPAQRGFPFCNKTSSCRYCPCLNKSGTVHSHTTGRSHICMKNISCRSSNLIYCITCTKCGEQYVGQTSLRIKDRFVHHFHSIERPDVLKAVGKHFSGKGHNGVFDLTISVLPQKESATKLKGSGYTY